MLNAKTGAREAKAIADDGPILPHMREEASRSPAQALVAEVPITDVVPPPAVPVNNRRKP